MKTPILLLILFFSLTAVLSAQEIRHLERDHLFKSKARQQQDWMEGNIDDLILAGPRPEEVVCDLVPNYYLLGYHYLRQRQMAQAEQAFTAFLAVASQEAVAFSGIGDYYFCNGEYLKAAECYDKAAWLGLAEATELATVARQAAARFPDDRR